MNESNLSPPRYFGTRELRATVDTEKFNLLNLVFSFLNLQNYKQKIRISLKVYATKFVTRVSFIVLLIIKSEI